MSAPPRAPYLASLAAGALSMAVGACGGAAPAASPGPVAAPGSSPAASPEPASTLSGTPVALEESWQVLCADRRHEPFDTGCMLYAVGALDDGTVVAGGGYYGAVSLGDALLPKQAYETAVLAAFDANGHPLWHRVFGTEWHNQVSRVVPLGDDVLVAGTRANGFDAGGARLPDKRTAAGYEWQSEQGYVAMYARDGRLLWAHDAEQLVTGRDAPEGPVLFGAPDAAVRAPGGGAWLLYVTRAGSIAVRVDVRGEAVERLPYRAAAAVPLELVRLAVDGKGAETRLAQTRNRRLVLSRFAPDGSTWSVVLAPVPAGEVGWLGALAVDDGGDAFVAWEDAAAGGITVTRVRAADGARAWTRTLPGPIASVPPQKPGAELAGIDRDVRTGAPQVSMRYRRPFVLSGFTLPTPPPPASDDPERDPRVRALATLSPEDGHVTAVGVFVPNVRACAQDYAARVGGGDIVFAGDSVYVASGEFPGYVPSRCPRLWGHYRAVVAKLAIRPVGR